MRLEHHYSCRSSHRTSQESTFDRQFPQYSLTKAYISEQIEASFLLEVNSSSCPATSLSAVSNRPVYHVEKNARRRTHIHLQKQFASYLYSICVCDSLVKVIFDTYFGSCDPSQKFVLDLFRALATSLVGLETMRHGDSKCGTILVLRQR